MNAIMPDGIPTAPFSSAEDLKAELASELDKLGNAPEDPAQIRLRQIMAGWALSPTNLMPDALIYPVRRDPAKVGRNLENSREMNSKLNLEEFSGVCFLWEIESHAGVDPALVSMGRLDERGLAVMDALTHVALYEDLEIFMIQTTDTHGDLGQEKLHYLDLMGRPRLVDFCMPRLDILSSSYSDCDVAFVICRRHPLIRSLIVWREYENGESLRDQILCFLIHHAAEHKSEAMLHRVLKIFKDGRFEVGTHVVNKLLICCIIVSDMRAFRTFHNIAVAYPGEPSVELFSLLKRAIMSDGRGIDDFARGLGALLDKLSKSVRLPDALWALESPGSVTRNPDGYVATWITCFFGVIEADLLPWAGSVGFEEAGTVIRICVECQDGFDWAEKLSQMFEARVDNGAFCLGLVLHMFAHLDNGNVSPDTVRSWYRGFRHHALVPLRPSVLIGVTKFSNYSVATGRSGTVDETDKTYRHNTTQRGETSSMFANMVQLGWHEEAVEFLKEFVLGKLHIDPGNLIGNLLDSLWFPFFVDIFQIHQRPEDQNWREIDPILSYAFQCVLILYTVHVVGREPVQGTLRRAKLNNRCGCTSCRAVNVFLYDGTKNRQLFQVIKKRSSPPQHYSTARWGAVSGPCAYDISRSALNHIVRQLDDLDRDCAWHTRETKAAGAILVLQKRFNKREWRAWSDRRETAKEKIRQFGNIEKILGKQHVAWDSLSFLERGSPLELTIHFTMDQARGEVGKTLLDIKHVFPGQFGSTPLAHGGSWKRISCSDKGFVIEWG